MRCVALGQAWRSEGGTVTFVSASMPEPLNSRLAHEGFGAYEINAQPGSETDVKQTLLWAQQHRADWIVIDGYSFDVDYQEAIKSAGYRLLVVDDYGHAQRYVGDLVLNHNLDASESLYRNRATYTSLLLGNRFVLLRDEFRRQERTSQTSPVARRFLITLGGSDPDNIAGKVLKAFSQIEPSASASGLNGKYDSSFNNHSELEGAVAVGTNNPHYDKLQSAASRMPHVVRLVDDLSMLPSLMAWADAAISAGGVTCLELCYMGLPTIAMITADNQVSAVRRLAREKAVLCLGRAELVSPAEIARSIVALSEDSSERARLSKKGRGLVDGYGADRVVRRMRSQEVVERETLLV